MRYFNQEWNLLVFSQRRDEGWTMNRDIRFGALAVLCSGKDTSLSLSPFPPKVYKVFCTGGLFEKPDKKWWGIS